ncbi:MAG: hypothetical protein Q9170_005512 [Blastenia crenularia]
MAPKPTYKDYGIPDEFAVPSGELVLWYSPGRLGSISDRCTLYNQVVIYNKLQELEKQLATMTTGQQSATINTANTANSSALATDFNFKTLPDAPTIPAAIMDPSQHDSTNMPPLIHRFSALASSSKPTNIPVSAAAEPFEPQATSHKVNIRLSSAPVNQVAYNSHQDLDSPLVSSEEHTMALSDAITQDLAGLVFGSAPEPPHQSPLAIPSEPAEEVLIDIKAADTRPWDKLHALGDRDSESQSVASAEHPPFAYPTSSSGYGPPRIPKSRYSNLRSISVRSTGSTAAINSPLPHVYQHTSVHTAASHVVDLASSGSDQPAWASISATAALTKQRQPQQQQQQQQQQQSAAFAGVGTHLLDTSNESGNSKEREVNAPSEHGSSTAATVDTLAIYQSQQQARRQRKTEVQRLREDYYFW